MRGRKTLEGEGEDLGGREPPLERRGSLPPNLPHSPRTSPMSPPFRKRRFVSLFVSGGVMGEVFCRFGRLGVFAECGFALGWWAGGGTTRGSFRFGEMLLVAMLATYGERKFIRTHAMPAESHTSHPPIGCDSRTLQKIRTSRPKQNGRGGKGARGERK